MFLELQAAHLVSSLRPPPSPRAANAFRDWPARLAANQGLKNGSARQNPLSTHSGSSADCHDHPFLA